MIPLNAHRRSGPQRLTVASLLGVAISFLCLATVYAISGGTPAKAEDTPWIVAILDTPGESELCTGTLIASSWVLTASHCFESINDPSTNYKVFFKSDDYRKPAGPVIIVPRQNIILHPNYHPDEGSAGGHDLALMFLPNPMLDIPVPAINNGDLPQEFRARAYGFGAQNNFPGILIGGNIGALARVDFNMSGPCSFAREDFICANAAIDSNGKSVWYWELKGTCGGDSGGPVFMLNNNTESRMIAITSSGFRFKNMDHENLACTTEGYYLDLSRFADDWIYPVIEQGIPGVIITQGGFVDQGVEITVTSGHSAFNRLRVTADCGQIEHAEHTSHELKTVWHPGNCDSGNVTVEASQTTDPSWSRPITGSAKIVAISGQVVQPAASLTAPGCLTWDSYPGAGNPNIQGMIAAGAAADQVLDAGGDPTAQARASRAAYLQVDPGGVVHANAAFVQSHAVAQIRQVKGYFVAEDWPGAVADGKVQRAIDALDTELGSSGCSGIIAARITGPGASDPVPTVANQPQPALPSGCLTWEAYPGAGNPSLQGMKAAGEAADGVLDRGGDPTAQARASRAAYLRVDPGGVVHANAAFVQSHTVAQIRQVKGYFVAEDWPGAVSDGKVQRAIDALDAELGSPGCSGIIAARITGPGASDPVPTVANQPAPQPVAVSQPQPVPPPAPVANEPVVVVVVQEPQGHNDNEDNENDNSSRRPSPRSQPVASAPAPRPQPASQSQPIARPSAPTNLRARLVSQTPTSEIIEWSWDYRGPAIDGFRINSDNSPLVSPDTRSVQIPYRPGSWDPRMAISAYSTRIVFAVCAVNRAGFSCLRSV